MEYRYTDRLGMALIKASKIAYEMGYDGLASLLSDIHYVDDEVERMIISPAGQDQDVSYLVVYKESEHAKHEIP